MFVNGLYTSSCHFALSVASFFFSRICSVCSCSCLFYVIFGCPCPLLSTTSKFNALLKTSPLSLLKTCPYHCILLALASPSKVSFKPIKLISSCLLFSIILTPFIALILLFQFFSKLRSHSPSDTMSHSHTTLQILCNSDKFFLF